MISWDKAVKISKKKMETVYLQNVKQYLKSVLRYIQSEHMLNMELDEQALELTLWNNAVKEETKTIDATNELSLINKRIRAFEVLLDNPEILDKTYEKFKNKKITTYKKENVKFISIKNVTDNIIRNAIKCIRELQNKNKLKYTEKDALKIILSTAYNRELNKAKTLEIQLLQDCYKNVIQRYNLSDKYIKNNNREFRQIGLKNVVEGDNINNLFKEFWSSDNLNKLSEEELAVLNIFWGNKKAKEINNINLAYSIIRSLGLYKKIVNDEMGEIYDSTIEIVVQKSFFQQELVKIYWEEAKDKKDESISEDMKTFLKEHEDIYKRTFGGNIFNDFYYEYQNLIQKNNAYILKGNIANTEIVRLLNSKTIKNWGVMEDAGKDNEKLLIGIDLKGFNMPIRVHLEKDNLQSTLYSAGHNTILPEYKGNDDFSKGNWIMKSHLIVPINKKYKEALKKATNNIELEEYSNTVEHLMYLANGKAPKHFFEKVPRTNSTAQVKHLVDINSGEKFVQKKGKIITMQEYNEMFNDDTER